MALDERTDSSGTSYRSLHWAPLRSWNLFTGRVRSRIPQESPSSQLPHSRSVRNCGDRERSRGGSNTLRGSLRGRSNEPSRKGGSSSRRDHNPRGSHRHRSSLVIDEPLILPLGVTMVGNEGANRRQVHEERVFEDDSSFGRTGRPSPAIAHHQQRHHHQQYHDHHHHHYHYHHLYHQPPRHPHEPQDQGARMPTTTSATTDFSSHSGRRNTDRQRQPLVNQRSSIISNSHVQSNSRNIAVEARERLAERLRGAALLSHRHSSAGLPGGFLEEFSLLFNDNEESWSDDEMWALGIQDWLASWGYVEGRQSDLSLSSAEFAGAKGLSRSMIRNLHREVFRPKLRRREKEVGDMSSEQDDCSVCLEHFLAGQLLIHLPCKHRFHLDCLTPWLESHGQCPYCRAKISTDVTGEASSSGGGSASGATLSSDDVLMAWMGRLNADVARVTIR